MRIGKRYRLGALSVGTLLAIACESPSTASNPRTAAGASAVGTAGTSVGTPVTAGPAGRAAIAGSGGPSPTNPVAGRSAPVTPPPPATGPTTPPPAANGGTMASAPTTPTTPTAPATPTTPGTWPAADPSKNGPFPTTTENMVGPGMAFTMFRPMALTQRHPVITWGNGTGTTPPTYKTLLTMYASHGFIVIASNSENVGQGTPPPMLDGVTWVLEQDMTQGSSLFEHVDREHIGATGHSQGAFAASSAGTDVRIKTVAPIETLGVSRGLHGPALGLCGTMDTTVPCSGNLRSFMAISDQPVMYAELKAADHTNWIYSPGGAHPYAVITTAWFRVQLMGDTALRPMFYGPDCSVCKDAAWVTMRKMMD